MCFFRRNESPSNEWIQNKNRAFDLLKELESDYFIVTSPITPYMISLKPVDSSKGNITIVGVDRDKFWADAVEAIEVLIDKNIMNTLAN